jgi:hypothetical protein
MFPDHLRFGAELFVTGRAEATASAADEIVHINVVPRQNVSDFFAYAFHTTGYFVS